MIIRDSETAFLNAIKSGLNADEYMYMYSDEKVDYFKHIQTRKYEKVEYQNELWQIPCLMSKLKIPLLILFFIRDNLIKSDKFLILKILTMTNILLKNEKPLF